MINGYGLAEKNLITILVGGVRRTLLVMVTGGNDLKSDPAMQYLEWSSRKINDGKMM